MSATTAPSFPTDTITAPALADHLARGGGVTVLDVRDEGGWTLEGAGVKLRRVPSAAILADPARIAATLDGPTVAVCNRGVTAVPVAAALRDAGAEVAVLDGGLRSWIGTLRALPLDIGVPGVSVHQVQRPGRGCLSYLVASAGRALVVDPAPDSAFYTDLAERAGARITSVFDTHIHADHLSGARALAQATGATLHVPTGAIARGIAYGDDAATLADGDVLQVGDLDVRVIALPGHTTDMTGLLLGGRALIGGDSIFTDGIARPDLQERDPGGSLAMARRLHATIHDRILSLGDDVLLLPGHTHPGMRRSADVAPLGQVRADVPELAIADPDAFAEAVVAAMPPRPANYQSIIAVNSGLQAFDPELESGGNSCSAR